MISLLQAKHNFLVKWISWYVMNTCFGQTTRISSTQLLNVTFDLQGGLVVVQYLKCVARLSTTDHIWRVVLTQLQLQTWYLCSG